MNKNLSRLVAYAEIISSLAILISLAFLAVQISNNTKQVRAASAYDATALLQSWYQDVGRDKIASDIMRRGVRDPMSLQSEEQYRFILVLHAGVLAYQNAFFLGQEDALDGALASALTETMGALKGRPGFEFYWAQRQTAFSPGFRAFIDGLDASNGVAPGAIYDPDGGVDETGL